MLCTHKKKMDLNSTNLSPNATITFCTEKQIIEEETSLMLRYVDELKNNKSNEIYG